MRSEKTNQRDAAVAIRRVVRRGNCTGCGACAAVAQNVSMEQTNEGYLRPSLVDRNEPAGLTASEFKLFCPGYQLSPPEPTTHSHAVFGRFVSVWEGHALDEQTRFEGSSGGVLSALAGWLVDDGRVETVSGVSASPQDAKKSVPVKIMTREEASTLAGSRYAPAAGASLYNPAATSVAYTAKPCEVAAIQRHSANTRGGEGPILLSFFCAGTPSQSATDSLASPLGNDSSITELRYRGSGWPGDFRARNAAGAITARTYDEAWGKYLSPSIQWRCKICPDGTGEHADIAVGDYWAADERGYPLFTDRPGSSVVIARTPRGHQLLMDARRSGVIALASADLDKVARVQPTQVIRRETLGGRLAGALLVGRLAPRYAGYGLLASTIARPRRALRAAGGTALRVLKLRSGPL